MDPAILWNWPDVLYCEEACIICNKTTKKRCSDCKTVYYCTKDHQKLHWKSDHKTNCGVIKLVEDPVIGRHYIAKRRIEPGEIVLREKTPLVTYIRPNRINYPICSNCYTALDSKEQKICNECKLWPLCSDCTQHGTECRFTIKYGKFKDLPDKGDSIRRQWNEQNSMIGVIRVLTLREKNPEVYSKILKYEDHGSNARAKPGYVVDIDVAKRIIKYFDVKNEQESEMAKICRILQINGFGYNGRSAGITEKASFFEHSCLPNCSATIPEDTGRFLIFAVKTIAPGEHVSISYHNVTGGTMRRKEYLSKTHFFDCTCQRCEDPTEFGTMYNAIKCVKNECKGDMLPESFTLCGEKYPIFFCLECKAELPWKSVEILQQEIEARLATLKDDVNAYKGFIEEHAQILHENHFLMVNAKLKLAYILGFDACTESVTTSVTLEELDAKINLSEEISKILGLVTPGDTMTRGRLLYGSAIALCEKYKRNVNSIECDGLSMKIRETLMEVCKLLCYESQSLNEAGKMFRNAKSLLKKIA